VHREWSTEVTEETRGLRKLAEKGRGSSLDRLGIKLRPYDVD
jgi:hypothetical protein